MQEKDKRQFIERIAKRHFGVETLAVRNLDSLDFYDVNVTSIEAALETAFDEGYRQGKLESSRHGKS